MSNLNQDLSFVFKDTKELCKSTRQALMKKYELKNFMMTPKLKAISLSVGAGKFFKNTAEMEKLSDALGFIAGQKPVLTAAKKSEASFDVREGYKIGVKVSLRKQKMHDFLNRLRVIYLPKIRDFVGLNGKSFNGNAFSFGIKDAAATVPEINHNMKTHDFTFGFNVTFIFENNSKIKPSLILKDYMEGIGFPFK